MSYFSELSFEQKQARRRWAVLGFWATVLLWPVLLVFSQYFLAVGLLLASIALYAMLAWLSTLLQQELLVLQAENMLKELQGEEPIPLPRSGEEFFTIRDRMRDNRAQGPGGSGWFFDQFE